MISIISTREILGRIHLREIAIVLVLMFFGVAGSIPGVAPNQANEMTGTAATSMQVAAGLGSQALVNGVLILLLFRQRKLLLQKRAALAWPCMLALWSVISVGWSQDPLLTARHALPFAVAAGFGCYLSMRFSQQRLLFFIQIVFVLLACLPAGLLCLLLVFLLLGLMLLLDTPGTGNVYSRKKMLAGEPWYSLWRLYLQAGV